MTAALCFTITFPVYWRNWGFHSTVWMNGKCLLMCVLLHNGNLFGAVPMWHSVCLCKEHGDVKRVLAPSVLLQYDKHNWIFCADLKMVCIVLSQQREYTKYPCFLCMWDSRAREKHWVETNWPLRSDLKPGDHSTWATCWQEENNIPTSAHKTRSHEAICFKYIILQFPGLSIEKIKASSSKMNSSPGLC